MSIIAVPTGFGFSKVNSFKLQRATGILRSKFTGQAQRIAYPYAVWTFSGDLVECDGLKAGYIRSFLAQLEGQKNSFRMPVPGFTRPISGYNGNPGICIVTTYARASSIATSGWSASVPLLAEGDYFTVNDELKLATAAVATNSDGQAIISFKPALRKNVAIGTAIIVFNPTVLMTAADDDVAGWSVGPPVKQGGKLDAVEAVEI